MSDPNRPRREVAVLAALGLIGATSAAVGAMVYAVVVLGHDTSALVSIGSIGIGAIATLAGADAADRRANRNGSDSL